MADISFSKPSVAFEMVVSVADLLRNIVAFLSVDHVQDSAATSLSKGPVKDLQGCYYASI